jgi:hypothetical protein
MYDQISGLDVVFPYFIDNSIACDFFYLKKMIKINNLLIMLVMIFLFEKLTKNNF